MNTFGRFLRWAALTLTVALACPLTTNAELIPVPHRFQRGDVIPEDWIQPIGTIRHDREDALYTGLAADPRFASVGRLNAPGNLCSGTLIGREWVLTAAHCVDAENLQPGQVTFLVGGNTYTGRDIFIHPDWTRDLNAGVDIAIIRLSSPVTDVTPARLNFNPDELGAVGTHVGFGRTGTGLTGDTLPAGTKRAGQNMIDEFGTFFANLSVNLVLTDFDHPDDPGFSTFGSDVPLNLEYMVTPGDSGGGLFADFGQGAVLAGVHSFVVTDPATPRGMYGDLSGSVRVSQHLDFILNVIPEPSSMALMAFGVVGLGVLTIVKRRRAVS